MKPIVEVFTPDNLEPTPEELEAYLRFCHSKKKLKGGPDDKPIQEAKASMTKGCQKLADACKAKRKVKALIQKGWKYFPRIVDARTEEVLFESTMAWTTKDAAFRCGERLIARQRKTGKWEPEDKAKG